MTLPLLAALALAATSGSTTLSLDEALRLAREHHPELRAAKADVRAADARGDEARAALLPQLGLAASAQRQDAAGRDASALTGSVSADQLVWDFGRSAGTARAGRASARAEAAAASETELNLMQTVRRAYSEARARRALETVARETLEARQRQLQRVAALVEIGSRPASDLARARSAAAQARVELVQARSRTAISRAQLARAMGLEGGAPEVGDDSVPPVAGEEERADALFPAAAAARPSLRQMAELVRAQEATLASARGALFPRVALTATASAAGARPEGLERGWTAGATLGWTFFDGGANTARVREAEESRASLLAQGEALRQQLRLELEEALASVEGAKAAGAAAAEALAAASEELRLAEARYETGAGTLLELSDARSTLATASGQVVQAEWDLSAARADLALALGRG